MSRCPEAGDIVWLELDPVLGREQGGRRPAVVLTEAAYNRLTERCFVCPVTSRRRGWAFEVELPPGSGVEGVVLCDQGRSVSWLHRHASRAGAVDAQTLRTIRDRLASLLSIDEG